MEWFPNGPKVNAIPLPIPVTQPMLGVRLIATSAQDSVLATF